jgi:hypothetical protein
VFGDGANPDSNNPEFVSYYVEQVGGAVSQNCLGASGYDNAFRHTSIQRPPIIVKRLFDDRYLGIER